MGALLTELDRQGIRTKLNGRRDGRRSGGIRFGVGCLAHLLKNRFYIGRPSAPPTPSSDWPVSGALPPF
jgi:hypothetical protein